MLRVVKNAYNKYMAAGNGEALFSTVTEYCVWKKEKCRGEENLYKNTCTFSHVLAIG